MSSKTFLAFNFMINLCKIRISIFVNVKMVIIEMNMLQRENYEFKKGKLNLATAAA